MRGSQPPGYEVRKVLRALEQEGLENMLPIWDDGRMIMMEGHVALVDDMKFATRKYRAPHGLEQVEMRQEGKKLDAAGQLHVALTEYMRLDPATPSPLSVDTPGDKRSGPVEDQFKRILERRRNESEEESMDETLSEAGEDMEVGNTPEPGPSGEELTTQELLKDLSEENWADTATPPLTPSPRKTGIAIGKRDLQYGDDTLELGGKGKEYFRREQGHVPGVSEGRCLAGVLEGIQPRSGQRDDAGQIQGGTVGHSREVWRTASDRNGPG